MIYTKIGALIFGLAGFGLWTLWGADSEQTRPIMITSKTHVPGVSEETRRRAFALLERIVADSNRMADQEASIEVRFRLADLLWEEDEVKARQLFRSAAKDSHDLDCSCDLISIETIAARDAKLALEIRQYSYPNASILGSDIYKYFVSQYPSDALSEAKNAVEKNRFANYLDLSSNSVARLGPENDARGGPLAQLYAQDPKSGSFLAKAIASKLVKGPIYVPTPYPRPANIAVSNLPINSKVSGEPSNIAPANLTVNRMPINGAPRDGMGLSKSKANYPDPKGVSLVDPDNGLSFSAAAALLALAANSRSTKDGSQVSLLSDEEMRALASSMVIALLRSEKFETYKVNWVFPFLKTYAPNVVPRLEKQLEPKVWLEISRPPLTFPDPDLDRIKYNQIPASPNETLEDRMEREFVNDIRFYSRITNHCNKADDAERFARFRDPGKYPDMVGYFDEYLGLGYAKAGKIPEMRRYLLRATDKANRLAILSYGSLAVAEKGDVETALKLLLESQPLVPKKPKTSQDLVNLETHLLALSLLKPADGFTVAGELIYEGNRLMEAAKTLREFQLTSKKSAGLELRRRQIGQFANLPIRIIRHLASSDFDRTIALSDGFSNEDDRIFFRWYVANALLNKNAEDEEARFVEVEPCG